MDAAYIATLTELRDDYADRLKAKTALPNLSWPETETYLRDAMLELARELREAEKQLAEETAKAASDADTECITQAVT